MAQRVGIPRCLLYYSYFPGWKRFFEEIGAEIVLSPPTNKKILDQGIRQAVDEICLPFKLFFGHVESLKNQVDYVFVPRIMSIHRKEWICPKFLGLPDMVRAQMEGLPLLISPDLNMHRSKMGLYRAAREAAKPFTNRSAEVVRALYRGLKDQWKFEAELKRGRTPLEILEKREYPDPGEDPLVIALLGHPYLIYESYTNMNLIHRLREMGAMLVTPEMIQREKILQGASQQKKDLFWTLNKKVMGAAYHLLNQQNVDGMVQLAAFGCGPDSLVNELIERRARREGRVPILSLNIDEHSGEAGLVTRLEAFVDMLKFRRKQG